MRSDVGHVGFTSLTGNAVIMLHKQISRINVHGRVGARGGWVHLRGLPRDASVQGLSTNGGWLGPIATFGLDVHVGYRVVVGPALEGGYSLVGSRADVLGSPGPGAAGG